MKLNGLPFKFLYLLKRLKKYRNMLDWKKTEVLLEGQGVKETLQIININYKTLGIRSCKKSID